LGSRVLITGGAGFIATHTALALLARGYEVRALDSLTPPVHTGTAPTWLSGEVELQVGDIRDRAAVAKALDGVEAVVHLAAYQDYLTDFSKFFHTNTVGTALIYELIVEGRLPIRKVVVASSQAVYGEGGHYCDQDGTFQPGLRGEEQLAEASWEIVCPTCGGPARQQVANEDAVNPQNQYALSKYTQELIALSLGRRYAIPTTCLRYSITQGRWQSPYNAYSGICRIFTLRVLAGRPPVVFEDGRQLRDYVYAGDVAAANVLALEDSRTEGGVYNVAGDHALSALEYAELVVRRLGADLEPEVPGYYRFGDTRHIVSDNSRLKALGWAPTLSPGEIIDEYAEWAGQEGFPDHSGASLQRMLELGVLRHAAPHASPR
jgi:dTDP-L-rhamnose 4-epimerase